MNKEIAHVFCFRVLWKRSSTRSSSSHLIPQLLQDLVMLTYSPKMRTGCHKGVGSSTQRPESLVSRALKFRTVSSW